MSINNDMRESLWKAFPELGKKLRKIVFSSFSGPSIVSIKLPDKRNNHSGVESGRSR